MTGPPLESESSKEVVSDKDRKIQELQQQLEQLQRKNEEQKRTLDAIHEDVGLHIWMAEPDEFGTWRYSYVTRHFERTTGVSAQKILGKTPLECVPLISLERAQQLNKWWDKCLSSGKPYIFEEKHQIGQTDTRWWQSTIRPVKNQDGKIVKLITSSIEITNLKVAEDTIRKSEARFRAIFENAPFPIRYYDYRSDLVLLNRAHRSLNADTSISGEQLIHRDDRGKVLKEFEKIERGKTSTIRFTARYKTNQQGLVWGDTSVSAIRDDNGSLIQLVTAVRDITETVKAEGFRQKSSHLIESTTDAVVSTDTMGKIILWNRGAERLYGYTEAEALGQPIQMIYRKKDHPVLERLVAKLVQGFSVSNLEYTCVTKSGEEVEILLSVSCTRDEQGNPIELMGIAKNVTERKRVENALMESEARFRAQFMGIPLPTYIWRRIKDDFVLVDYNAASIDFTKGNIKSLKGITASKLYSDGPEVVADFEKCYREQISIQRDVEYKMRTTGEFKYLTVHYAFVPPNIVMVHTQDISERLAVQRENVRLERFKAIGELAAGVCHNLNNMLTGILGPAQMVELISSEEEVREEAQNIILAGKRAADLVQNLYRSVRPTATAALEPVELHQTIRECITTTQPKWRDEAQAKGISIQIKTDFATDTNLHTLGTETGLLDILVNLMFNAVDAMPKGGCITIKTERREDRIILSFQDSGIGMDEETKNRAMEPFFTTKQNIGTGLGLTTLSGTMKSWGGQIELQSQLGKGTTFILSFPIYDGSNTRKTLPQMDFTEVYKRILVVDDNQDILRFFKRKFGREHYVETYVQGQDALEAFSPQRFDVAVVDLGLPGIPGNQVIEQLREQDPGLLCIMITGWPLVESDPRMQLAHHTLQKPFVDLKQLERLVLQQDKPLDTKS